ncbi:CDP-glycerol glycerophosphotransferase [Scopulibacillus darangshiensis]|uniref:CDP-glycerol glycerophosphotransferase n=1 Tax=Scopulibacillus darangshiensis TaxID=442528 RepID=A0A4R2NCR8_9BACL|nr:CDP-glycerol glycerophosphotransferase family protein [Scopulibacillus darangshiensis]TCP19001.1 CDP-glycerol glycerophosphotransferase [Scopulibacillus darangshiensis]
MSMLYKTLSKIKKKIFREQPQKKKKYQLVLKQTDDQLYIEGKLGDESFLASEIWLMGKESEKMIMAAESQPSSSFQFKIDLSSIQDFHDSNEGHEETYFFYLKWRVPREKVSSNNLDKLTEKAKLISRNDGGFDLEYLVRLGRFQYTETEGLETIDMNGNKAIVYISKKGNISLAYNKELNPNVKTQIDRLKIKKERLIIEGKLYTKHSMVKESQILLSGRDTGTAALVPVSLQHLKEEVVKKYGLNRYAFQAQMDLSDVFAANQLTQDVYDLYCHFHLHDQTEPTWVKLGKPRFKARYFMKDGYADLGKDIAVISPYFTFKQKNLALQVEEFERDAFKFLQKAKRWAWLIRPFYKNKDIWLIGERSYKAQDTGFHFFKYMRENHPAKNVFYVIEEDSPERENVEPYGNVVLYKSKRHIWLTLMATRAIGSHHPDYLYPIRSKAFKKAVKATKVFLQHGVMGTKNMVANYGKTAPGFDTDLFLVSSDFEKQMIVSDFGYDANEVKVTGLSRFDNLLKDDEDTKRQLLIIPTWRDWIVTDEAFLESDYFIRYKELIFDEKLHRLATEQNFEILLCLHPNMQKFTHFFSDAPVRIINQGDVDVQRLLKESAMMITDYSSVGFDFSFLHKPIIYYQFDRDRFIGKRPSHLDLDNDLPGDIVYEEDDIIPLVEDYAKKDFRMKEIYKIRTEKFMTYRDQKSSERIYQAIKGFKVNKPWYKVMAEDELARKVFQRFRKSRWYFPAMKLGYNIGRRALTIDNNLIVFESGVGKQYADSPRYIYEEILKRNLDYNIVWVCNKKIRFYDENTKRIKRLSPYYYFYLAKARYWVNNQNFPTYLKKREGTTYVQTWHGTPLKKMLFDIETVHGRSDDYVERVHQATKTWDYLISPSSYATNAFRSAFRYKGDILEIGYPRNDLFYKLDKETIANGVRRKLKIPEGKKVILYAPTFRDNQKKKNKFVFDINLDFEQMKEQLGEDYVLLLRMHVVVKNKVKIPEEYRDFVYNVSNYPDIQELYLISDILVTDYSSVMFDFANLKRPMLFYTYDFEEYRDDLRGFYMDFENEAPGPLLSDSNELIDAIENVDEIKTSYQPKYDAFHQKYCGLEDGKATDRLIDHVFNNGKPRISASQ